MPPKFVKREIVTPKLSFKIEIELTDSTLTPQEAANKIEYAMSSSRSNAVSEFIVFLLRETRSSTWDLKNLEIT